MKLYTNRNALTSLLVAVLAITGPATAEENTVNVKGSVAVDIGEPDANGLRELRESVDLRFSFADETGTIDPATQDLLIDFRVSNPAEEPAPCLLVALPAGCFGQTANGFEVPDLATALQCGVSVELLDLQQGQLVVVEDLTPILTDFRAVLEPQGGGAWELQIHAADLETADAPQPCLMPRLGASNLVNLSVGEQSWRGMLWRNGIEGESADLFVDSRAQLRIGKPDANNFREVHGTVDLNLSFVSGTQLDDPVAQGILLEFPLGEVAEGDSPCLLVSMPADCFASGKGGFRIRDLAEAKACGLAVVVESDGQILSDLTGILTGFRAHLASRPGNLWSLRIDFDTFEEVEGPQPCLLPRLGAALEANLMLAGQAHTTNIEGLSFHLLP